MRVLRIVSWNVETSTRFLRSPSEVFASFGTPHVLLFIDVVMPELDLVDTFRAMHPRVQKFSWFRPGARRLDAARVDQILVSSSLLSRVRVADIDEAPEHRFGSDHAPVILEIAP